MNYTRLRYSDLNDFPFKVMNICYLTPEFPHPNTGSSGGIGTSIKNLAQSLANSGHNVFIVVYGQDKDEVFKSDHLIICRLKNVRLFKISWLLTQKKIQYLLSKLIKTHSIDILEVPDWTGFSAFINVKIPVVMRLNGSDSYFCKLDNRPIKWFNYFLERRAFKRADSILSVSKFTGELTNALFRLKRDFLVVPNGVDTDFFKLIDSRKSDRQIILYFGTLIRKKGVFEIPSIFNLVNMVCPDAELVFIGKDSTDKSTGSTSTFELIQTCFSKSAICQVSYLGAKPYDEIKQYIISASVCIFPSFAEALPVSWIEAMALQTPMVCSNIGWASELIDHEINGYLVDPKDHITFSQCILNLLNDTELAKRMGINARKKVMEKFSSSYVADLSLNVYQKILTN